MIGKFIAVLGLQIPLPLLRFGLSFLSIVAAFLTGLGLIVAAAMTNDNLATKLLPFYPRYSLAMQGFAILQDIKYPALSGKDSNGKPQFTNIAVLSVDDPAWAVMLDFIRSETAIRKSERNQPAPPTTQIQSPAPANPPVETPPQPPAQSSMTPQMLPPIDFQRIKTIASFRADVMTAGSKPLVPPYNLVVLWPPPITRTVYEFLSFEEFRLDLRRMMLDEIQGLALWASVIAFACTLLINALRAVASSAEQRQLVRGAPPPLS
jgi:hypothetical protein